MLTTRDQSATMPVPEPDGPTREDLWDRIRRLEKEVKVLREANADYLRERQEWDRFRNGGFR